MVDRCALWLIDLATGEQHALTDHDGFASMPRWSPDGNLIAYVEGTGASSALMLIAGSGGTARRVGAADRVVVGAPTWSPDGQHLAVAAGKQTPADVHLTRVRRRVFRADGIGLLDALPLGIDIISVTDGRTETLVDPTDSFKCTMPQWSPAGDRILFFSSFDVDAELTYFPKLRTVDVESGDVHDVLGRWGGCQAAAWLSDGERIAFIGAASGSRAVPNMDLWVVDATGRTELRTPGFGGHAGCRALHDMPVWDLIRSGGLVVGTDDHAYITLQSGGDAGIWSVALDGPAEMRQLVGGSRTCIVLDQHPDVGQLFVATDMFSPTELFLATDDERQLTHLNDDVLATWPSMRSEHLKFAAPDGRGLEGWFLARDDAAGALPTVLNIHQGPYMSVGHAFRFDLHLLASHGIGVMFSNFRGSTGYGQEFMDAIGSDGGAGAFPDHMAAIDAAIESGFANPDRLGLWGASYGGFATCWAVGHTDRFRAALAEAAITDLAISYYTSDIPDVVAARFGGRPPNEVPDLYRERSPITYAAQCRTPILMLHCENDLRCPVSQAEAFHRAVLDAGCVSELAVISGGSHSADSVGPPHVRLAQNKALLDWFVRYLIEENP